MSRHFSSSCSRNYALIDRSFDGSIVPYTSGFMGRTEPTHLRSPLVQVLKISYDRVARESHVRIAREFNLTASNFYLDFFLHCFDVDGDIFEA